MVTTWSSRFPVVAVAALALSGASLFGSSATRVAPVTSAPARFDPYKNFRYVVKMEGRTVAGLSVLHGLPAPVAPSGRRAMARSARTFPPAPQTARETITLERGMSHDVAFVSWASQTAAAGTSGPAIGLRRDVVVEVRDEAGRPARSYKLARAWVSVYQAMPDLDASAHAVSIQHLVIVGESIAPTP